MQNVGLRDTAPELALRRVLHRLGFRYRLHREVLAGSRRRADIVFGPQQVAVFVDGCFWHGCPQHGTTARKNRRFWQAKVCENQERDRDTDRRLERCGWRVVRVWEHEEAERAARRVGRAVKRRADR